MYVACEGRLVVVVDGAAGRRRAGRAARAPAGRAGRDHRPGDRRAAGHRPAQDRVRRHQDRRPAGRRPAAADLLTAAEPDRARDLERATARARAGHHRGRGRRGDRAAARRPDHLRAAGDRRAVRRRGRLGPVLLRPGHRGNQPGGRTAGDHRAAGPVPLPGLRRQISSQTARSPCARAAAPRSRCWPGRTSRSRQCRWHRMCATCGCSSGAVVRCSSLARRPGRDPAASTGQHGHAHHRPRASTASGPTGTITRRSTTHPGTSTRTAGRHADDAADRRAAAEGAGQERRAGRAATGRGCASAASWRST